MLKKIDIKNALLFLLLLAILPNMANAQKLPDLKKGMNQLEVLQMWGGPLEKVEYEIKRKDEWIYKDGRVIFENGAVITWFKGMGSQQVVQLDATPIPTVPAGPIGKNTVKGQDVVDDILSEIMKDPSNNDPADRNAPVVPVSPPVVNGMVAEPAN